MDRVKNAVHCTDLPEDGVLEVKFKNKHCPIMVLYLEWILFQYFSTEIMEEQILI